MRTIDIIVCALGIPTLASAFFTVRRWRRIAKWTRAMGTISERDVRDSPEGMQGTARLRFVDPHGNSHFIDVTIDTGTDYFGEGDSYPVVYDPSNPDKALLARRLMILGPPFGIFLAFAPFAVAFLIVALVQ